jgi:hypothetical protein
MPRCVECGRDLEPSGKGRPPDYCGMPCRRSSEYRVRRAQRRLEALEADSARLRKRLHVDDYWTPKTKRDDEAELEWTLAEIERREVELRTILGAHGEPA